MQPEDPNHGRESGSPRDPLKTENGQTGHSRTSGPGGGLNFSMLVARLRDTLRARDERSWSVLAHLSVLLWLIIGPIGGLLSTVPWLLLGPTAGLFFGTITAVLLPAAPLILWLVYKDRFPTVRFHAAQAFWYQVACIIILGVGWFITVRAGSSAIGYLLVPVMSLATFVPLVYGCYAAYKVSQGIDHRYPVVADMIERGAPTTSRFPTTSHPFFRPQPDNARQEVLAGVLAAVSVAGALVVLVYVILGLAGAFEEPLFPFNLGLAIFSLIHGGGFTISGPPIPFLEFRGGYFGVGLPATLFALLPFVAMLILGRIFARRIGATVLFAAAAALAYAVLVCISAALGSVSVSGAASFAPGPLSTATLAFLWAGLGVLIGTMTVNGPPLPERPRQVIRGAFTATGVSLAIALLLVLLLALADLPTGEAGKADDFAEGWGGSQSLILLTMLPNIFGTLWLFAHGLPLGVQGSPELLRGVPGIGSVLSIVPLKVGLLGTWPFGGAWRLLLLAPLSGFVVGGRYAARGAPPDQRWWQGALIAVPYTVLAAFVAVLFCRFTFDPSEVANNPTIALGTSLPWLLALLPVGGALGALGGLLVKNVPSTPADDHVPLQLPSGRQEVTLEKSSPRAGDSAKTTLMTQQLASVPGILDLSADEALDEAQKFLTSQGYDVVRRTSHSLIMQRGDQQFFLPDSASTFTSTLEVLVHPQPEGGVRMKIMGNDSDPLPRQQQARWSEWADSLPKKAGEEDTSEIVPQGREAKEEANTAEQETTVSIGKADTDGDGDISDLLERFEAAEDRLGVRLEGLFARRDQENRCIHLSGELHARDESGELGRDLEIVATIHDSSGRVMHKQSISCRSESFFGFDAFSLSMEAGGDPPAKIRVYPKAL